MSSPGLPRAFVAAVIAVSPLACAPAEELPPLEAAQEAERGPRTQPGTSGDLYTPEQHPLYGGRFMISAGRFYQVGTLADTAPWDHMGDDASNVRPVEGTIEIDADERANTGTFRAELDLPEGTYVVSIDRFEEFSPCQDGGIAAWLFEHGDSGCGDTSWPKSILYVAGWGWGDATLNGEPLRDERQIHFMVTQGMRDRETPEVRSEMGVRPLLRDGGHLALAGSALPERAEVRLPRRAR